MSNVLSTRLRRLERSPALADPYAHLSDDQLAARIEEIDRDLETATGLPARAYARMLEEKMLNREPLPEGISEVDARSFVSAIRSLDAVGAVHVG